MECQECGKEITEKDISEGNYREGFAGICHEMCPTNCFVCGEKIESFAEATQTMAGTWKHKNCNPQKVRIPPQSEEEKEFDREAFANRIIKKRRVG